MKEESFGIVPLRKHEGKWEVFLVQHRAGHWAVPKGHVEGAETPIETAQRELFEETGLSCSEIFHDEPFFEEYRYVRGEIQVEKRVGYFIALVTGKEQLQEREIRAAEWLPLAQAKELATFQETKNLLQRAESFTHLFDK